MKKQTENEFDNPTAWMMLLWDLNIELKNHIKNGHKFKTPEDVLCFYSNLIHSNMQEKGLYFPE